ncbi:DgyrCDS11718 [Dimorphilus gyrociliatus]|uniref:DgyrCDS11718 n=1 Tax=Dimorphilus gyrociliatus TaxID=2664684 RepID=A0A7I8W5A9_9ANNE|nr:DgyrCDS11718 [Dimorphilus gyrociliatus]
MTATFLHVPSSQKANKTFLDFAERFFNVHVANSSSPITKTVSAVRRKSTSDIVAIRDMVRYTKQATISTSLIHFKSEQIINLACSAFKDICKIVRGETRPDQEDYILRSIFEQCFKYDELTDEIFCQLARQTNGCPIDDYLIKTWDIFAITSSVLRPSATLLEYLKNYVSAACKAPGKIGEYAKIIKRCLGKERIRPKRTIGPSTLEVESIRNLQPLLLKVHFYDGKTKALALDYTDTVLNTIKKIREKINLKSLEGWALYEEKVIDHHQRHLQDDEFITEIVGAWQQQGSAASSKTASPVYQLSLTNASHRLIFAKRIITTIPDIDCDPVELHFLYSQAVYHTVDDDEYQLPSSTCIQLAGLHAQVLHGDYEEENIFRYTEVDSFLCKRVLDSEARNWPLEISLAHKKFGNGKKKHEAQIRYLSLASQFPLFGSNHFLAYYKGYWILGLEILIAVNKDGIKFISLQQTEMFQDIAYMELESVIGDTDNRTITFLLKNCVAGKQKCFVFELNELKGVCQLIDTFLPNLIVWEKSFQDNKSEYDWLKLNEETDLCRKKLVQTGTARLVRESGIGFFRSAIRRLSRRSSEKLPTMQDSPKKDESPVRNSDSNQNDILPTKRDCWTFTKNPLRQSITKLDGDLEEEALQIFTWLLMYSGIESASALEDNEPFSLVQKILSEIMQNHHLCNELYLQLIKQTMTNNPESFSKVLSKFWHCLIALICVRTPANDLIEEYLRLHLQRCSIHKHLEEGRFASFASICLSRTKHSYRLRKNVPSKAELKAIASRKQMELRVFLQDGHQLVFGFFSDETVDQLIRKITSRTGMRPDAEGLGLYASIESNGSREEKYLLPSEIMADMMCEFEGWMKTIRSSSVRLSLKKRIFIEPYANLDDPVEIDMLYHQSVTDVFEKKIPLTQEDAIRLCALRAQTECGDYQHFSTGSYNSVTRILPRPIRDLIDAQDIAKLHMELVGLGPQQANEAFLRVLQDWPLYGAKLFGVKQTTLEDIPKKLWFGVGQIGVHLMEQEGQVLQKN